MQASTDALVVLHHLSSLSSKSGATTRKSSNISKSTSTAAFEEVPISSKPFASVRKR